MVLEMQAVTRRFRSGGSEVVALADVTLTVGPGGFVAVMGATGSGKSTLLTKLDLPPAAGDHRRVLAVLRFIRAAGS